MRARSTLAPSMMRLLLPAVCHGILFLTVILALALARLGASLIIVVVLAIVRQQSISKLAATIVFAQLQPFSLGELIEANDVLGHRHGDSTLQHGAGHFDNKEIALPNGQTQCNNMLDYTRQGRRAG